MLADLDDSISALLKAELPIKNGEIDIKFDQPKREWSARLTRPTINFYLYDVRENVTLRQHAWEKVPNGRPLMTGQKRMPFRFDCTYMLTVWANEPEDEHNLLAHTLLALLRFPIIRENYLVGQMQNQIFDIAARVGVHDKLTNPAEVWGSLDNELRPTIPYILTVPLDPWTPVEGPMVRSFSVRTGQADALPYRKDVPDEKVAFEKISFGGIVTNKGDEPQAGLDVALEGTGFVGKTDAEGRYRLGAVEPGNYTLIVWPESGRPKKKKVSSPAKDGDYNLKI